MKSVSSERRKKMKSFPIFSSLPIKWRRKKLLEGKVLYAFAYYVLHVFFVFFFISNFSFVSFLFFLTLQREAEINEGSFIRRMKNLVFYLMIKKMLDAEFVKCRNRRSFFETLYISLHLMIAIEQTYISSCYMLLR